MGELEQYKIVKTLDNPPRFLFWEVGECIALAASLLIGGALESVTVIILGLFFWALFRRVKKQAKEKGVTLFHLVYWHFPTSALKKSGKFKNLPCSHKRDIIL